MQRYSINLPRSHRHMWRIYHIADIFYSLIIDVRVTYVASHHVTNLATFRLSLNVGLPRFYLRNENMTIAQWRIPLG